jgi:AbrB family looped-hinge helix DNA binding protein
MAQDTEITTMSEKGQVVIPLRIREGLKIKPRTKFLVSTKDDVIIMKAFELPSMEDEWSKVFKTMDKKNLKMTEKDIANEIRTYRAAKRKK